jgi:NTE family protein
LEPSVKEALIAGLESIAEVRVLGRQSYGAGMPGALAVDSPEIAHWLHEQELEFDLTVIVTEEADQDFAQDAVAGADSVLFIGSGEETGLSPLEIHAQTVRGAQNCRLALARHGSGPVRNMAAWIEPRRYGTAQALDFTTRDTVRLLCQALLGKGTAIAAASRGVYAASIMGALQACEQHGLPAACLAAAGSAILPAGLLAMGQFAAAETIFQELANPLLWKRFSRAETGLCDPAALDGFLVGAMQGLEIAAGERPFAAVSRSLSAGAPQIHREGRLHGAVRAGIAPPGILPPLILDSGDILVSGETEAQALLAAAQSLTPAPVSFLHAEPPPLGSTPMSYRSLTGGSLFRLTQTPADKRVRLETVLSAGKPAGAQHPRSFAVPIPEGILPMDWPQWAALRTSAYDWMAKELERHTSGGLARDAQGDEHEPDSKTR